MLEAIKTTFQMPVIKTKSWTFASRTSDSMTLVARLLAGLLDLRTFITLIAIYYYWLLDSTFISK